MKRECPSLFAALLVSLLVNVLLRSQTPYWPRAGLFSAVVCAPLLAGVGWLFARSWRLAADPVYKLLFGALLVYTSVLELLRLWQLADRLYPGAVTLTLGLSARCAACCLSAAGFGAVPDGLCRALSAGTGNRRHAGIGASAAVHRQSANCRTDTGRFSRRRQRPADALPGIPAARALARAGQAWPPYAAAAGRVGTGV